MGAIGFMGAAASLIVLLRFSPPPSSLAEYALIHGAMAGVAKWVLFPSYVLTLIPGLLSLAVVRAFQNAGWAWVKAATGVLIFMGGLHAIAPIQDEARQSAAALAGQLDPAAIDDSPAGEEGTLWLLLAVSTANVVLGVWRPRLVRSVRGRGRPVAAGEETAAGEAS
jgi:hypothetical protein